MEKQTLRQYAAKRLRDKSFATVLLVYLLLCLGSALYWCVHLQVRNLLMSIAFMAFVPLCMLAEHGLGIRLGTLFTAGVLGVAFGSILGSCFNVYTQIPFFDTLLHGVSGLLFACLGFVLAQTLFGRAESKRRFYGCLAFAVCFSLAIAVLWEIFEYGCTELFGYDMMDDCYVTSIRSYLLAGSHAEVVEIDGIVKTVIYYGNGQTYTINGYMELGLIDTMTDMIVCTVGAIVFAVLSRIGYTRCPRLNRVLIPQITRLAGGTREERDEDAATAE